MLFVCPKRSGLVVMQWGWWRWHRNWRCDQFTFQCCRFHKLLQILHLLQTTNKCNKNTRMLNYSLDSLQKAKNRCYRSIKLPFNPMLDLFADAVRVPIDSVDFSSVVRRMNRHSISILVHSNYKFWYFSLETFVRRTHFELAKMVGFLWTRSHFTQLCWAQFIVAKVNMVWIICNFVML